MHFLHPGVFLNRKGSTKEGTASTKGAETGKDVHQVLVNTSWRNNYEEWFSNKGAQDYSKGFAEEVLDLINILDYVIFLIPFPKEHH